MKRFLLWAVTHLAALGFGFALGVYLLPILIAPEAPTAADVASVARQASYHGEFRRNLKGSDVLHWGEGRVSVGREAVALLGRISAGPAYKLYLAPEFVETKDEFLRIKAQSAPVGDVRVFQNFIVPVPPVVDISHYTAVVVWCEAFSQFITAAKYR